MFFILALGPLSGNLSLPGCSQARIKNILHGGKRLKLLRALRLLSIVAAFETGRFTTETTAHRGWGRNKQIITAEYGIYKL